MPKPDEEVTPGLLEIQAEFTIQETLHQLEVAFHDPSVCVTIFLTAIVY